MKLFLGIDPGKTGGYALVSEVGQVVHHSPFTSWWEIKRDIFQFNTDLEFCCIEKVGALSADRKRLKSMATLMRNYGGWLSFLECGCYSHELIAPTKWQNKILGSFPKGESKLRSMDFVQRKFPKLRLAKSNHGCSDAICIALYARILCGRKNK